LVEAVTASSETVLDLRGLKCPLPALFARRALELAVSGAVLEVIADDPMAIADVPHMCRQEGYEVVSAEKSGDEARFVLRKG
jgi:tRNA 2-thiouridine synthesizing protein A